MDKLKGMYEAREQELNKLHQEWKEVKQYQKELEARINVKGGELNVLEELMKAEDK